jgi:hypothetical protein
MEVASEVSASQIPVSLLFEVVVDVYRIFMYVCVV